MLIEKIIYSMFVGCICHGAGHFWSFNTSVFFLLASDYFVHFRDTSKNPFNFDILDGFSDDEKYLMMSEGRPKTMNWIVLCPKKLN